jgi:uncharacterized protein (DUF2249 family)
MHTTTEVDVRPIEPRYRYEIIMDAYNGLGIGESMQLTVDHDPQCMYYTLRATRGDDAFGFEYIEHGPETWRVVVTRFAAEDETAEMADTCH